MVPICESLEKVWTQFCGHSPEFVAESNNFFFTIYQVINVKMTIKTYSDIFRCLVLSKHQLKAIQIFR